MAKSVTDALLEMYATNFPNSMAGERSCYKVFAWRRSNDPLDDDGNDTEYGFLSEDGLLENDVREAVFLDYYEAEKAAIDWKEHFIEARNDTTGDTKIVTFKMSFSE